MPRGEFAHVGEDLRLARGCAHLEGVALEARGVLHVHGALGHQLHDGVVDAVDLAAQTGEVGRERTVVRVGETAHGGAMRIGFALRLVLVLRRHSQSTHLRALCQICIHGLWAAGSPAVQDIWMLRNTRSGWGMSAVKRPAGVVPPVWPPAPPLGLKG